VMRSRKFARIRPVLLNANVDSVLKIGSHGASVIGKIRSIRKLDFAECQRLEDLEKITKNFNPDLTHLNFSIIRGFKKLSSLISKNKNSTESSTSTAEIKNRSASPAAQN
jgi:hypothetical protein